MQRSHQFAAIFGALVALGFIVPTAMGYSETPSDPQKVIGYFFITAYGAIVGMAAGFSAHSVYHGYRLHLGSLRSMIWILLGIASGVAAVLLFMAKFQAR